MPASREIVTSIGKLSGSDKFLHHGYDRFYPGFFGSYDGSGSIVEIGYGDGKSIRFWKELYPAAFLYIFDRDVEHVGDGFNVSKLDQSSAGQLSKAQDFLSDKDVKLILDDGSHIPDHQLITFNHLFSVLRPGGVYIIEDIECSYWRNRDCYGYPTRYGLKSQRSLINNFLMLSHWVNRQFLAQRERRRMAKLLRSRGFDTTVLESVASVEFAHNCLAVRKCLEGDESYANRSYRFSKWVEPTPMSVIRACLPAAWVRLLAKVVPSIG